VLRFFIRNSFLIFPTEDELFSLRIFLRFLKTFQFLLPRSKRQLFSQLPFPLSVIKQLFLNGVVFPRLLDKAEHFHNIEFITLKNCIFQYIFSFC
jgi:hypothetical protein